MEDAVHPFEGADQGFFVSDVGLKQRRQGRGRGVRGPSGPRAARPRPGHHLQGQGGWGQGSCDSTGCHHPRQPRLSS